MWASFGLQKCTWNAILIVLCGTAGIWVLQWSQSSVPRDVGKGCSAQVLPCCACQGSALGSPQPGAAAFLQAEKLPFMSEGYFSTSHPVLSDHDWTTFIYLMVNSYTTSILCCRMHDKKIKQRSCHSEMKCRAQPAVTNVSHQPSPVFVPQEKGWTPWCSQLSLLLMSTLHFTWEIWKITKEGQRLGKRVELRQRETTGSSERFILLDLYQLFRPDSRSCSYNSRWQTLQLGSSSEPAWELYHPCPVGCCSLFASPANSD